MKSIRQCIVLCLINSLPMMAFSQTEEADTAAETPAENTSADGSTDPGMIDGVHGSVDNLVQNTVRTIDGFFVNSEFSTFNDKKTRIRVRLNSTYIQKHGWEFSPKVKLHLVLPGLNSRLRLVVNDDQGPDAAEAATSDDADNDVALRWIGKQNKDRGYSFDLGLRIKDSDLDPFGRINAAIEYALPGKWVGQSTNRIYYYSKTGLRNDYRQYFNRYLNEKLLVRSRTRIQYFEENVSNPFLEQKFSLYQSVSEKRMIAYELMYRRVSEEDSPFDQDEVIGGAKNKYNHFIAQMRFRQQFLRPWFFVEFWPIVAWPEERDYSTILGARIRLEVNLGGSGDRRLDE